jgi:choline dehydrogenase-like flavoprotein
LSFAVLLQEAAICEDDSKFTGETTATSNSSRCMNVISAGTPRLNNRKFNMALGDILGGGTSINVMVWMRGMQRDYDRWAENGAKGWAFADVLPVVPLNQPNKGGRLFLRRLGREGRTSMGQSDRCLVIAAKSGLHSHGRAEAQRCDRVALE